MSSLLSEACDAASVFFGEEVTPSVLREKCRRKPYVRRRWFVMAYLKQHEWSYPRIAGVLRMGDHATVMHGRKKADELWGEDQEYQDHMFLAAHSKERRKLESMKFAERLAA